METYTTEEQEIEAVKKWWSENGLAIGLGIVIGFGGIFGWRGYQSHLDEQAEAASEIYESMLNSARAADVEKTREYGQQLSSGYASTNYAVYSAMIMAKFAIENGDLSTAKEQLEFAQENAKDKELKSLAELRLARVAYAEDKAEEALSLLNGSSFFGFAASASELKGDIYSEKGDMLKAKEEYALAISQLDPASDKYEILEMKLDSVGRNMATQ